MHEINRRKFVAWGLGLPAAALTTKVAVGACADPDDLSDSVMEMRESMEYTATSSDPKTVCGGCMFFKSARPGDNCGQCEVLHSPVNSAGHCVSWTKRV